MFPHRDVADCMRFDTGLYTALVPLAPSNDASPCLAFRRGNRQIDLFLSLSVCLLCSNALYYRPASYDFTGKLKEKFRELPPMFHQSSSVQE
jgi:hypothetical protein